MLSELQFVQGSVARKDFTPALVHFHIHNGRVQGYNGILSLSCPIDLDLDVTPNAMQLIKAVRGCKEAIALSMTSGGRLAIKSGNFKAFVECFPGGFPEIHATGKAVAIPPTFLEALRVLAPCVAEDASRQWARGVLFRGQSAFATNNVVLVEYYLGTDFPFEVNIPLAAVDEILRIGELPEDMLFEENAVTFRYSGERWLRTQLYTTQWPDLTKVLYAESSPVTSPITVEHIDELLPFLDETGRLYLKPGELATSLEEGIGAKLEIPELQATGVFSAKMLRLALEVQDRIDLTTYPAPCHFIGKNLRGAIIGMRTL